MTVPAPFFSLTDLGLASSSTQILQQWLANMQAAFPGYEPSLANLEYVEAQIIASFAADLAQLCSSASAALFQTYGTQLIGVPFQAGVPASAVLTVTAADSLGHTLAQGEQVTLTLDGAAVGFATASDLVIAPGATTGNVVAVAINSGTAFNGAGAPASVIVDWVSSLAVVTNASGGSDQEDDVHYNNRLAGALQLMAPRPITASDFAAMALNFTPLSGTDQQDVGRAAAIDGYDALAGTLNNQRTVTVCIADASGDVVNADTLAAVKAWLVGLRELNFIVYVVSPNYSNVYVTVTVAADAGYSAATVKANVQSSLLTYLSPTSFGLLANSGLPSWQNATTIYRSRVESVIQNTKGVDHVVGSTLALGLSNPPTNVTDDMSLPGPFPLPVTSLPGGATTITLSSITVV